MTSSMMPLLALALILSPCCPAFAQSKLPPVRMDSFVEQAGSSAELIYGDEGEHGLPPYYNFTREHRINSGIKDTRDSGLTTGHGSILPSAWGADEYLVPGGEWDRSGFSGDGAAPPKPPGDKLGDLTELEARGKEALKNYIYLDSLVNDMQIDMMSPDLDPIARARAALELASILKQRAEAARILALLARRRAYLNGT